MFRARGRITELRTEGLVKQLEIANKKLAESEKRREELAKLVYETTVYVLGYGRRGVALVFASPEWLLREEVEKVKEEQDAMALAKKVDRGRELLKKKKEGR